MSLYEHFTSSVIEPSSLPEGATLVTNTSFMVITRNAFWPSPALQAVGLASLKCLPAAQCLARTGEALSYTWLKVNSPGSALPRPEPPPVLAPEVWVTSQLHDRSSISPLWSLWVASPSTPSNLM